MKSRRLTGIAIVLPLLSGVGLVALQRGVDQLAAKAVPVAVNTLEASTGLQLKIESARAAHPLKVVLRHIEARRTDGSMVSANRIRAHLSLWSLLKGKLEIEKIVFEGVAGEAKPANIPLVFSGALIEATSVHGQWRLRGGGWSRLGEAESLPFTGSLDQNGNARLEFPVPLPLPVPGLPPSIELRTRGVVVDARTRRAKVSGLSFRGLPDGLKVGLDSIEAIPSRGNTQARLQVNGLVVDTTADALQALRETLKPTSSDRSGKKRLLGSAPQRSSPHRPIVRAENASVFFRHEEHTINAKDLDVELHPNNELVVDARLPPLSPSARLHASLRAVPAGATKKGTLALGFDVKLTGGRLIHPAVSPAPLDNLHATAAGVLSWHPRRARLKARLDAAAFRGARFSLAASVERLGRPGRPRIKLKLKVPEQPCDTLFNAAPWGMWSVIRDARLAGDFKGQLAFSVDLDDIEETISLSGQGDPSRCKVLTLGEGADMQRLASKFVHHWPRTDGGATIDVGPGVDSYLPLSELPAYVRRSMVVTEDGRFWRHNGVSLSLIQKALKLDLTKGGYIYGGSTITQQLVKNLFLTRKKTLTRKIEEAILALHMEQVLSKRRILELYVNIIEFGPDVYGIHNAARYYFDRLPTDLEPIEGAFLATIKPMPSAGPKLARKGRFGGWWHHRLVQIMGWLVEGGYLSEEQRAQAAPFYPRFRGAVLKRPQPKKKSKRRGAGLKTASLNPRAAAR